MKYLGLLAASFTAVKAWTVTLYGEAECTGTSYFVENAPPCRQPPNLPADFDAKSMFIHGVASDYFVFAFTDNNLECQWRSGTEAPLNTWVGYSANGGTACHE